ncbi:alkylation response protein AidB-like acyl-CoA dehydrogenase [Streptomyces sp. SAI-208]|nr:alkylation response protein AidB-like acyl-CoA dehydrogenase [Streptomyces sp. SAI-208]
MDARFTAEQDQIRSALRDLLRRRCGPAESRSAADTPAGYDPALWTALAEQLGLPALALPEEYGGVGCSVTELALACEETGRVLAATPLLSTAVLVAPLVLALGTDAQRTDLLPRLASGSLTAALAAPPATALALTADNTGDWSGGGRAGGVQARRVPDTTSGPPPSTPPPTRHATEPRAAAAPGGSEAAAAGRSAAAGVGSPAGAAAGGPGAVPGGSSVVPAAESSGITPPAGTAPGGSGAVTVGHSASAGSPVDAAPEGSGSAAAEPSGIAPGAGAARAGRPSLPVAGHHMIAPRAVAAPGGPEAVTVGRSAAAGVGSPVGAAPEGSGIEPRAGAAPVGRMTVPPAEQSAAQSAEPSAHLAGRSSPAPPPRGSGWRLYGQVDQVLDGHSADVLLVAAHAGGFARSRTLLFVVRGDAPGLVRTRQTALDATRPQARVQLRDVEAELLGADDGADVLGALARTGDTAAAVLACEAVGAADRVLEMTVEHVGQREQFGRAIGSFQAVKHRLADVYVQLQAARSAAYFAAWAAVHEGQRAGGLALAQALEALRTAAAEGIQLHGGIGFTWEHEAQRYFKRATSDELLFGPAHRLRAHAADAARLFTRAEVTV